MIRECVRKLPIQLVILGALCLWPALPALADGALAVHITNPKYDSEYASGEAVFFTGSVKKNGAEVKGLSFVWRSNLDGKLGTGTALAVKTLSVGIHRITLDVFDQSGIVGSDTVKIKVSSVKSDGPGDAEKGLGTGADGGQYIPNPFN